MGNVEDGTEEEQNLIHFVNWWNAVGLLDARQSAVTFLRSWTVQAEGEAREAMLAAAALYGEEVKLLRAALDTKSAFLGPRPEWTPGKRQHERKLLAECRRIEKDAVAELRRARELMSQ